MFISVASYPMPVEWIDNISDWRWISPSNQLYQPNPNWFEFLPQKFTDAIQLQDRRYAKQINSYLSSYLLALEDEPEGIPYKTLVLFPIELPDVSSNNGLL